MRMTFTDAGSRHCPMQLNAELVGRCWGPQCMAWRWDRVAPNLYVIAARRSSTREPVRPVNVPSSWKWLPYDEDRPAQWMEPDEEAMARSLGYCGLAGKPGEKPTR